MVIDHFLDAALISPQPFGFSAKPVVPPLKLLPVCMVYGSLVPPFPPPFCEEGDMCSVSPS